MQIRIEKLQSMIDESEKIVFFGGAGVSTESGIPDFRSKDGLYNQKYDYPPETILSNTFFLNKTEEFYKFYKDKMNCMDFKPNVTHKYLAKLEDRGKLLAIITQNIDGLHQKAGSKNVIELHGTIYENNCMKCGKSFEAQDVFFSKSIVPICKCGGVIKPKVILYEEPLGDAFNKALDALSKADLLIIGGTSLSVYPAANLIYNYFGKNVVVINKDKINDGKMSNLFIQDTLGNVFKKLMIN